MITATLADDLYIQREIRNMFTRTNILARRFAKCSTDVKIILFKAYCFSLYDADLWFQYSAVVLNKLRSCYQKCLKFFFGFKRRDSVTLILLHLRLPSFNTIIHNSSVIWYKDGVTVLPLMKLSAILMIYYLSVKLDN